MTNEEAIRILEEQRNRFMDEYVDFGGVNESYNKAIDLLKEQEEQKQKWLKQIAYAQLAVCPTGNETEEELAKLTGEWNGLQMAFDILTNGR